MEWKYKIGDRVKFMPYYYDDNIIDGIIVAKRKRFFFWKEYLVEYGIGLFGVKTSDAVRWIPENKVVRVRWKFPTEEVSDILKKEARL